jgi:hypothetical protein
MACTVGLLALLSSAPGETIPPGYSQPADISPHRRPVMAEDLAVALRNRPAVPPQAAGPNFKLLTLMDVNNVDFNDGSEPSIAVDPENPNLIVVHGGFGDWGSTGQNNASLYVSTNGGVTWRRVASIDPPTNADLKEVNPAPHDATIAYGGNSVLTGSFLGKGDLFTGTTVNPTQIASFRWRTIVTNGVVRAQPTEQISTHHNDQPWVVVHRHRPDPIIFKGQPNLNFPLPIRIQNDVYVAYDDFETDDVPVRVAVSPAGANPPNFTVDKQVGVRGSGAGINPGHRLAVAPRTVFRDGTVGSGFVYSLHQRCDPLVSTDPPLIDIVLNCTTDRGGNWGLNGNPEGMLIDRAISQQPTPKFGTVNALFGGMDQLAVDPSNGVVYVVYGVFDPAVGHNRLAVRKLFYEKCNEFEACNVLVAGPRVFVDSGLFPAALPAIAVAANGIVGVLYDTFDGTDNGWPVFTAHLALADGRQGDLVFTTHYLLTFLSTAQDDSKSDQRVWGDFQQMVAVGDQFCGVFAGNGASLGRAMANTDPIFFKVDVSNTPALATAAEADPSEPTVAASGR